ncbi:GNAT family N-acetyltransferase [Sporosalibacterium faouarense]|uniref:GNAT family N-acetyltransferase n=1 Tax=Sporosalibacterium faouarense TaxID=516123 RepID=UPI00141C3D83|nr:GNAT family N-acetyltransferase [Sporosalibacterium faouarense]MTI46319.1 GNAT family N-acetyltransferase [Bacillota bacterium]
MQDISFNPFPILKTDRLLLRQLKNEDDIAIFEYQSNKDNFKFVDMPVYKNIKEAQNYIEKMNSGVRDDKWIIWAIADATTDKALGTISIWNILKEQSKAELGYGLFPGNVGKGIMSEALKKVVEYGINVMGLETIEAYTNIENNKSKCLLKRNNFIKVSLVTDEKTYSRVPMEMVIYEYKLNR